MISHKKALAVLFLFLICSFCQAQFDSTIIINFNGGIIKEKNNLIKIKSIGVTLTDDRFGNNQSAAYIHGHRNSYLNLSTSNLLKKTTASVSLWVRVDMKNYFGKGYPANPIIITRNSEREDFTFSYGLLYEFEMNRFSFSSMRDSIKSVSIFPDSKIELMKWYHIVFSYNSDSCSLYINGHLEGTARKDFISKFNFKDSVLIGHSGSEKNLRYFFGAVDDIKFFNKVISPIEVLELYEEPNPNKIKKILNESLKYLIVILVLVIIIVVLIIRNKKALKQQKEKSDVQNKISELELKVVKAQMNPHFISNCLAAIQELIYSNQVEKAGQYIAKFSFFLRQVLNFSDKNYISLSEELDLIKLNIELEQLRFKNEFEFKINIESEIDTHDVWIPALLTQPFIENAIWHGLLPLGNKRRPILKINIYQAGKFPFIEIEDNGIGRNLEDLNKEKSKGTKLVFDKVENLNRLSGNANFKIQIIDLFDERKQPCGTKIIIQLNDDKL